MMSEDISSESIEGLGVEESVSDFALSKKLQSLRLNGAISDSEDEDEEVKEYHPEHSLPSTEATVVTTTATNETAAVAETPSKVRNGVVRFQDSDDIQESIKSSSSSVSGDGKVTWKNINEVHQGEKVEAFLLNADIGSVIFSFDTEDIKHAIFNAMERFEKYGSLQLRAIQLLQDCHMLTPGGVGITNIELGQHFEVLLRVLSSWLNKADIVITMFELLAMVADREVMKERCGSVANSELLQFMARALEIHSNTKEVQRAGLMLYECILQHATDRSRRVFAEKMFRAVLDNLQLNNDDPFICYASFSILDALAGTVNKSLLKPFTDQLINLTLSCIASLHSSSVVCKCLEFLEKLTEDPSTLSAVAGHNRGLWIFVDAVGILQAEEIGACISCLEMMQKIVQDKELLRIALENIDNQGESRVEHVVEVEAEFRQKCDKYIPIVTECRVEVDERVMEYWIELSELVLSVLVKLPTEKEHIDAANRIAERKHAISSGIDTADNTTGDGTRTALHRPSRTLSGIAEGGSGKLTLDNLSSGNMKHDAQMIHDEIMSQASDTPSLLAMKGWSFLNFTGAMTNLANGSFDAQQQHTPTSGGSTQQQTKKKHKQPRKTGSFDDHRYMIDNPHLNALKRLEAKRRSTMAARRSTVGYQSPNMYGHQHYGMHSPYSDAVEAAGRNALTRSRSLPASEFVKERIDSDGAFQGHAPYDTMPPPFSPYPGAPMQHMEQQHPDRPVYIPSARIPRSGPPLKPSERTMSKVINQAKKGVTLVMKDTSPGNESVASTPGNPKSASDSVGVASIERSGKAYRGPIMPRRSYSPMGFANGAQYQEAAARETAHLRNEVRSLKKQLQRMSKVQAAMIDRLGKLLKASNIEFDEVAEELLNIDVESDGEEGDSNTEGPVRRFSAEVEDGSSESLHKGDGIADVTLKVPETQPQGDKAKNLAPKIDITARPRTQSSISPVPQAEISPRSTANSAGSAVALVAQEGSDKKTPNPLMRQLSRSSSVSGKHGHKPSVDRMIDSAPDKRSPKNSPLYRDIAVRTPGSQDGIKESPSAAKKIFDFVLDDENASPTAASTGSCKGETPRSEAPSSTEKESINNNNSTSLETSLPTS